jgi:hypothetical protein
MSFMAYDPAFLGGITVASGDVNRDGFADVIVGPGAGGGPHVRVFSGFDGSELMSFMAYDPGFFGGVTVAAGDANGDGFADVIVGPGAGGGPHVRVFSGMDGSELLSFFAFDPGFTGGVRVAAGDVNLDGQVDIFITTGPGTSPIVRVVTGSGVELGNFSPFGSAFTGGAFVAGGPMPGETLLLAGGTDGFQNPDASVSQDELSSIVTAAIARFEQAGLSNQGIEHLNDVVFRVVDLSGRKLGLSQGNTILIDVNAAGQGWFIDATPDADEEFAASGNAIALQAQGRVDLLTVVLHELGHRLGLPDLYAQTDSNELMAGLLAPGQRRLPGDSLLDNVFTDDWLLDSLFNVNEN